MKDSELHTPHGTGGAPNMRKSLTEFLAGGIFALATFSAVAAAAFFVGADSPYGFFERLTYASAGISAPEDNSAQHDSPDQATANQTINTSGSGSHSYLSGKLMQITNGLGWGLEEAPQETEEPEDENEPLSEELPYPDEFSSDGGQIIRKTYSYEESSTFVNLPGGGMLRNSADKDTDYLLEQAEIEPYLEIELNGEPQVLIMHTHTTECYEPYARDRYDSEFSSRTTELDKTVCAVGEEIAAQLEAAGIGVIHDTTVHDYPKYTGAYDRSSERVEELLSEYPSIKVVLDVHRDAIESDGVRYAPVCEIDGKEAAQVMIICGCMNVPQYRYNLRFATKLQSKLESDYPGFTRPILFAERNYNQELTPASILLEMGSSSNSLEEAMYSGKLLGMSLAELLLSYAK